MDFDRIKKNPGVHAVTRLPFLLSTYHFLLALFAALWYGFPSRKLIVIGVTGTKGKTTTCNIIAQILREAGYGVGLTTTAKFQVADREWVNTTKQTMPGRFALQRMLREMVRAGCTHAVIETSSEGILQHRHRFIHYRAVVFTNLSPEHIERHGSFENYRDTKIKLFQKIAKRKDGIGVYNLDDPHVDYFLSVPVPFQYGFTMRGATSSRPLTNILKVDTVHYERDRTSFTVNEALFTTPLLGEFNVVNAVAALSLAEALGVPRKVIYDALSKAERVAGRFEIARSFPFTVIVDYAHEPASLEAAYRAARIFDPKRMIAVLGAQGGGRDRWKRPVMGAVAANYADVIILTNEDPYDEDPASIIADIKKGVLSVGFDASQLYEIIDRREAIANAIALARDGDLVIATGKGGEVWMCIEGGKKIPWDERKLVDEILLATGKI